MARYFAVIIEKDGFELFRRPVRVRTTEEVADGLATAYREFRAKISDDGLPADELTIRFESRFESGNHGPRMRPERAATKR